MTRAEARTAIRASTDHESDTQVTDAQLNVWLDIEHKLLCRQLAQVAPQLMTTVDEEQTLDTDEDTLTFPDDFERIVRIERLSGTTTWYPVEISDELSPHLDALNAREEQVGIMVAPVALAPGTYRLVYVWTPVTLAADTGDTGTLLVPAGCEDIICERVCARVREKFDEDPSSHIRRATDTWREQKTALRRRYGKHGVPGLRQVRRW